jgi:formiminotetrahydrofolate cyclodeaminase
MRYGDQKIKRYLKDLAAKTPAPGGGSVAALSCALAASLVAMACRFTLGKDKYRKSEQRIKRILAMSLIAGKRASVLVDLDAAAYFKKDLKTAIQVPQEVCLLSYGLMTVAVELLDRGNKNLATDTGLAVLLSEASFTAALSYVAVNIKNSKKKVRRGEAMLRKLRQLAGRVRSLRRRAEVKVGYSSGR